MDAAALAAAAAAAAAFEAGAQLDARNAELWRLHGRALRLLGDLDGALASLERAAVLAPGNLEVAGTVIGRTELMEPVRNLRGIMGGVNSPHNAYLLERGLKTLALRMERHNANGLAVARFLEGHPRVERVLYPGLESHPFHGVAARTMRGCGGLVTFFLTDADWRRTADVIDAVQIPRIGPSLGGVESLIEQPLVMSYWNYTPQERQGFRITDNMIRMACGIEDADDLISDLAQSLDRR